MRLGYHISTAAPFSAAIDRAEALGCECAQIFVNPPQRWNPTPIKPEEEHKFVGKHATSNIEPIISHSIYLINLASDNTYFYQQSQVSLIDEMKKAAALSLLGANTHLGSTKERSFAEAKPKVVAAIKHILKESPRGPYFIIENSAGAGSIIGDTLQEIGEIVKDVASKQVKVLIDTAHAFASGYDIRTAAGFDDFLTKFDKEIGLDCLIGFHLNDSASALGSKRDRHANIGDGEIGAEALRRIVNHPKLKELFGILETPSDKNQAGKGNLEVLRG